jgi:hypothetical protein
MPQAAYDYSGFPQGARHFFLIASSGISGLSYPGQFFIQPGCAAAPRGLSQRFAYLIKPAALFLPGGKFRPFI